MGAESSAGLFLQHISGALTNKLPIGRLGKTGNNWGSFLEYRSVTLLLGHPVSFMESIVAAIFEAHEAILQDPSLRQEIRDKIKRELIGAAHALARVFHRWHEKFRALPQELNRERANDLVDLEGRLLREMAGVKTTALEMMPSGRVLVAHRQLPSETVAQLPNARAPR